MVYQYDQLHRIKRARAYGVTATAGNGGVTWNKDNLYSTQYAYDANGNLKALKRYAPLSGSANLLDNLTYHYNAGKPNRLDHITEGAVGNFPDDNSVSGQSANNYGFDEIGNLISDNDQGKDITWTVYGKVASVGGAGAFDPVTEFTYDPAGNRLTKKEVDNSGNPDATDATTIYVRDASGNIMAVYQKLEGGIAGLFIDQKEVPLYGSARLGLQKFFGKKIYPEPPVQSNLYSIHLGKRGDKLFEQSNHLGNVLATVADLKVGQEEAGMIDGQAEYYVANVHSAQDYYPFGWELFGAERRLTPSDKYRFGFNGKEKDENGEWGSMTNYDYGFRIYNPGIARFLSVDPLTKSYPELTPYQFASNSPIMAIDQDGKEMLIIGSREFKQQVEYLVKGLAYTKHGRKLLTQIANSGRILIVKDADDVKNYVRGEFRVGVEKEATWGSNNTRNDLLLIDDRFGTDIPDGSFINSYTIEDSPIAAFGHELQHFIDPGSTVQIGYLFNTYEDEEDNFNTSYELKGFGNSEINAVHTENIIRTELGKDLRNYYAGLGIRDVKLDVTKKHRLIYDFENKKYGLSPSKIEGLISTGKIYDYSKHKEALEFSEFTKFFRQITTFDVDTTPHSDPKDNSQKTGTLILFPNDED